MKVQEEGTDKMKEIALYVREGAMAYLKRQYSVVGKVFIILVVLLTILAYFGIPESLCSCSISYGRILFGILRFSWNEDRYICIEQDSMGCIKIA